MELKEEYKSINLIEKMEKRIEKLASKENKKKMEYPVLEKYYKEIERLKKNNWLETYCALSLLEEKTQNIKLHFYGTSEGIIGNTIVFSIFMWLNDSGEFLGEDKQTVYSKENTNNLTDEQVIVEAESTDIEKVKEVLNSICDNWQETIILKVKANTLN